MTDSTPIDSATADRLARLQQRRGVDAAPPLRQAASAPARAAAPSADSVRSGAGRRPRNGSPAAGSKIVAAGASAMAVLGMVALFGQQAGSDTTEATAPVESPAVSPASASLPVSKALVSAGTSSVDVEPPNVVVLVDPENNVVVATPSVVAAPTRIELAIPAPRQVVVSQPATARPAAVAPQPASAAPAPAPAAAPAPAPAPAPVATTQGS